MFESDLPNIEPEITEEQFYALVNKYLYGDFDGFVSCMRAYYESRGIFCSFKPRGGGVEPLVAMPYHQFLRLLVMVDAKRIGRAKLQVPVPAKVVSEKPDPPPMVKCVSEKPSIPTDYESDAQIEKYIKSVYEDRVKDLQVIIFPLDRDKPIVFPGDGVGAGYRAARNLGFSDIHSFDSSAAMCRHSRRIGNDVICDTIDGYVLPADCTVVVSHIIDYYHNVVEKYRLNRLIMFEQYHTYRGYSFLTKTRLTYGYHVASNIPDYDPSGVISLSSRSPNKPFPIYESIINNYTRFVFLEKKTLSILTYLLWLDPQRRKHYSYVGADSEDIARAYGICSSRENGRSLVFGSEVMFVGLLQSEDMFYNIALRREMSVNYLEAILPHMSPILSDELYRLGFNPHTAYSSVYFRGALVYSSKDNMPFKTNVPYPILGSLKEVTNVSSAIVKVGYTQKEYAPYNVFEFKNPGYVQYNCRVCHGVTGSDNVHRHVTPIENGRVIHDSRSYKSLPPPILVLLPRLMLNTELEVFMKNIAPGGYHQILECVNRCIAKGVLIEHGAWIFNPHSTVLSSINSIRLLDVEARNQNLSFNELSKQWFGVIVEVIQPINFERHDYLYQINGIVAVDAFLYKQEIAGSQLHQMFGLTPDSRALHKEDLVLFDAGQPTWAARFFGRAQVKQIS